MNYDSIVPEGDLPPNHPLVLEALKGIISGPISELRQKVDKNITVETAQAGLRSGKIDYDNILPQINNYSNVSNNIPIREYTQSANNVLETLVNSQKHNVIQNFVEPVNNVINHNHSDEIEDNPDQMQLSLFKQTEISDLYSKMFDLERKLDTIIKYVKTDKN
jgi:hypothetical protein